MFIDCKVTVWKRIHFNENVDSEKVIQALEKGGIDDVFDDELGFVEQEILFETAEEMTPEENGGHSTIEAYSPAGDLIWSNGKD
jgi:hypothetical protein